MTRSPKVILGVLIFATLLATLVLTFGGAVPEQIFFLNDTAISFAIADLIRNGEFPLLGPPSHVGARHLGPAYYWYTALTLSLAHGDVALASLFSSGAKLFTCFLAILIVLPLVEKIARPGVVLGVMLCLLSGFYVWVLRVQWHSNYLLIPGTLAIGSAMIVLCYGPKTLPLFLLTSSVLIQSHFSSFPLLCGLSALLLFRILTQHNLYPSISWMNKNIIAVCLFLTAVSWTPLLCYELSYPSILKELFRIHLKTRTQAAGLEEAIQVTGEFVKRFTFGDSPLQELFFPIGNFGFFLFLVCAGWILVRLFITQTAVARWQLATLGVSIISFIPFLARATPPIHHYYLQSITVIPALIIGVVTGTAIGFLSLGRKGRLATLDCIFSVAFLFLFLLAGTRSTFGNLNHFTREPFAPMETLAHAETFSQQLSVRKAKDFFVFVDGQSRMRESSYYFFLGRRFYQYMQYADTFQELPSMLTNKKLHRSVQTAYFIHCPKLEQLPQSPIWRRLRKRWQKKEELLDNCHGCRECTTIELERRSS